MKGKFGRNDTERQLRELLFSLKQFEGQEKVYSLAKLLFSLRQHTGNNKVYSLSMEYVQKKLEVDNDELENLAKNLNDILKNNHITDWVNIFRFPVHKVLKTFIGVESDRIRYFADKDAGTNPIEKAIKEG